MSYILEALKMSEQSRRQGSAAAEYSLLPQVVEEESADGRAWRYALLAGFLLLNAVGITLWLRPAARAPAPEAPLAMPAKPAAQAVELSAAPRPAAPAPASAPLAPLPAPIAIASITPPPVVRVVAPPPVVARAEAPAPRAAEARHGAPAPKEAAAKTAAVDSPPAAPKPEPAPVQSFTDGLPAAVEKQLPPLAVSGFIGDGGPDGYVIVNDKLVHEGEEAAPGVKLVKIRDDGVVFEFKGHRFKR